MSEANRSSQDQKLAHQIERLLGDPSQTAVDQSQQRLKRWFRSMAETIWWGRLETPIGDLYLAAGADGLRQVSFAQSRQAFLSTLDPRAHLVEDAGEMAEYRQQLEEYFEGRRRRFALELDLATVTPFQRAVLAAADAIPIGEVRTYGQIASELGKPKAARAVGQALGSNPLPIILPCHRVIASDGSLGGYGGGLERKQQLLQLEGAR